MRAVKRMVLCMAVGGMMMVFTGCGAGETVYLEQAEYEKETAVKETSEEPEAEAEAGADAQKTETESKGVCYVYICGAIAAPGVYEMPSGSRIYEVVERAGGLTQEADRSFVNQAERITDGQMLFFPTGAEVEAGIGADVQKGALAHTSASDGAQTQKDTRVNINTAELHELMTIPGIGETKAARILEYRNAQGRFFAVEDIMLVDGIKEGLYNRIKDHIKVN